MSSGNTDSIKDAIRRRYAASFQQHGATHQGLLYGSPSSQTDRFMVISRIADYEGSTVLDVGCGFADLLPYLRERHGPFTYTGIDLSPDMIATASQRYPGKDLRVGAIDTIPDSAQWDFVIESGIFNTNEWTWQLVEKSLRDMWSHCSRALIATFLSRLSTGQSNAESAYFDTGDLCRLASTMTRRFSLLHTYRDNDFTLVMFRDERYPGTGAKPEIVSPALVRRPPG